MTSPLADPGMSFQKPEEIQDEAAPLSRFSLGLPAHVQPLLHLLPCSRAKAAATGNRILAF